MHCVHSNFEYFRGQVTKLLAAGNHACIQGHQPAIPIKPSGRLERSAGPDTTLQEMGFKDVQIQTYGAAAGAAAPPIAANGSTGPCVQRLETVVEGHDTLVSGDLEMVLQFRMRQGNEWFCCRRRASRCASAAQWGRGAGPAVGTKAAAQLHAAAQQRQQTQVWCSTTATVVSALVVLAASKWWQPVRVAPLIVTLRSFRTMVNHLVAGDPNVCVDFLLGITRLLSDWLQI